MSFLLSCYVMFRIHNVLTGNIICYFSFKLWKMLLIEWIVMKAIGMHSNYWVWLGKILTKMRIKYNTRCP